MTPISPRLLCPLCNRLLTRRERGPQQDWLQAEYVCIDIDCLEFGIYRVATADAEPAHS